MPKTKSRTISYLRAHRHEACAMTLQDVLRSSLDTHPTAGDTELSFGDGAAQVRHRLVEADRICLHIAKWTDREEASTVPHATSEVEEDLAAQPPGQAWDYLNGDGMFLASKEHCLIMPSGLPLQSIVKYVRRLIHQSKQKGAPIPHNAEHFELLPIANKQIASQLRREGMKKLHLNIGQYHETAIVGSGEDRPRRLISELSRTIWEGLVTKDDDRRRIKEAANVTAQLVISLDGRRSGLKPEQMGPMLDPLVSETNDEDDVQIETGTGQLIRRGRLVLKKKVAVAGFAETVHHVDAWEEMFDFLQELVHNGALGE